MFPDFRLLSYDPPRYVVNHVHVWLIKSVDGGVVAGAASSRKAPRFR